MKWNPKHMFIKIKSMYWKEIAYYLTFPAFIILSWYLVLFALRKYKEKEKRQSDQ